LISKIINMAEKIKDAEDRLLEPLFDSPVLADDGFSAGIVNRINRRLWFRRLTLPVAAVIGGLIAFKPLTGLVATLANLSSLIPQDLVSGATSSIPQLMSLRDKVEELLPNWERWYPSLFDAASDLGIIRAEVCDPDSLNLNRRHAKVRQRARDAHLEKWGGKPQE